jgi:S-adenosylmethionine synthetase
MCLILARIVGLPHGHIIADDKPPSGEAAAARPKDCRLYTRETASLLDEEELRCTPFEEWWREHLRGTE